MKIQSSNEYSKLRSVIVGTANNANWPSTDPEFRKMEETTRWKNSPVPSGPVEQSIIEQTEMELETMCNQLVAHGVEVYRPWTMDYQAFDGMYGYCPRDRLLIIDDKIILSSTFSDLCTISPSFSRIFASTPCTWALF